MATWLHVDASPMIVLTTTKDGRFTLRQLQILVGGYIELVRNVPIPATPTSDATVVTMVVDEDGFNKLLPINTRASALVGKRIVGNAVLLSDTEMCE